MDVCNQNGIVHVYAEGAVEHPRYMMGQEETKSDESSGNNSCNPYLAKDDKWGSYWSAIDAMHHFRAENGRQYYRRCPRTLG